MKIWELAWMRTDSPELTGYLADGWEPFAVTHGGPLPGEPTVWLRREKRPTT